MIGLNHGFFVGYVHKEPKFLINKKDHPQCYLTIQQPNPRPAYQAKRKKGDKIKRSSIYMTTVCFDEMATKVRDKVEKGDFVVVVYTIRNIWRAKSGFGHAHRLVNVFPWRPTRGDEGGELDTWCWEDLSDPQLVEHEPPHGGEDGDRAWSFPSG